METYNSPIIYGGVDFNAYPAYGSGYDSILSCEQSLLIVVCDDCLKKNKENVYVETRKQPERPQIYVDVWDPDKEWDEYSPYNKKQR